MTRDKAAKPVRAGLKILVLLTLIAVIFSAVLVSMNENEIIELNWDVLNIKSLIEKIRIENTAGRAVAIDLSDLTVSRTAEYNGDLLVLTDYDIRLVDQDGEEIWYFTHEIRNPELSINGNFILVYEKNGKSYMVINEGKVAHKDMLDEEIAFGEVNDDYIMFITVGNNGYKRTVNFISPETGISIGALYIDDYFPYYLKTVNNSDDFILYGLGMNSTDISTIIRIYESSAKTAPIANVEIEGLYPVMYGNGSRYILAGENKIVCYDDNLDLLWSKEYTDKISAAGLFENSGAVVALSGEQKMIKFYSQDGEEIKSIEAENSVQNIKVYDNTAAVILGSKVLFYNNSGRLIGNASMPGLSLDVHFVNGKQAYLVTEHEAVLYNISGR